MEKETFTMRKNFLENHFKKKIVFYIVDEENNTHTSSITYKSNTLNCEYYNKHFVKKLKEFSYYQLSKCLKENKILEVINIDMNVPYEDISDETLINPTFNEELLFHNRTRVLRLENFRMFYFVIVVIYLYAQNVKN